MSTRNCFIIMPITTPENLLSTYNNNNRHFIHVLEEIFIPALELCGYNPIPPKRDGSENIHAEIVKHLIKSDLVFCDITGLNPNVFFELGCRTALNKPVCYVKDNNTNKIPFDNASINHYEYNSSLLSYDVKKEIPKLSEHIKNCSNQTGNSLWKYFNVNVEAHEYESNNIQNDKTDIMFSMIKEIYGEINLMNSKLHENSNEHLVNDFIDNIQDKFDTKFIDKMEEIYGEKYTTIEIYKRNIGVYDLIVPYELQDNRLKELREFAKNSNMKITVKNYRMK